MEKYIKNFDEKFINLNYNRVFIRFCLHLYIIKKINSLALFLAILLDYLLNSDDQF